MIASLAHLQKIASAIPSVLTRSPSETKRTAIVVPRLTRSRHSDGSRILARIDNQQIYFGSQDIELKPTSEALGCCLLLPALHSRRALKIEPSVCELWARQVSGIPALIEPWWGYPSVDLDFNTHTDRAQRSPSTAACFSCGVDSFYTLLKYPAAIDALVCVLGYDVKLRDRDRAKSLESGLRNVAAEHAMSAIIVTTNLRHHRLMKAAPWERTHGGSLAAIGHLISESFGTLIISSSGARILNRPWGSHWDLDPKFGSSAVEVQHFGDHTLRSKKLIEIAQDACVRKYLRVCWEYRNTGINCGVCEKCIRTMLTLDTCGQLGYFHSFQNINVLARSIAELPNVPTYTIDVYEFLLESGLTHSYQAPVQALIARSKLHHYGNA